jgi:hypothetical protein
LGIKIGFTNVDYTIVKWVCMRPYACLKALDSKILVLEKGFATGSTKNAGFVCFVVFGDYDDLEPYRGRSCSIDTEKMARTSNY